MPVASRGKPSGVAKVFWAVSIVCAVLGGIVGVGGVAAASGARQEASAAAIGCLITIAPSCLRTRHRRADPRVGNESLPVLRRADSGCRDSLSTLRSRPSPYNRFEAGRRRKEEEKPGTLDVSRHPRSAWCWMVRVACVAADQPH